MAYISGESEFIPMYKMAKWILRRLTHGNNEEYELMEGEDTSIGRAAQNKISLKSILISKTHGSISIQNNKPYIKDLKSMNGIYVGAEKIPPNTPYELKHSDIIGMGWKNGIQANNIKDDDKYDFQLLQIKCEIPSKNRIQFQSETESDIELEIVSLEGLTPVISNQVSYETSPIIMPKVLKRKLNNLVEISENQYRLHVKKTEQNIISLSDSEDDIYKKQQEMLPSNENKKPKLMTISEEPQKQNINMEPIINNENEDYDLFAVKQEYLGYDDEPINIESDSDSESAKWLERLSQCSPGKPFTTLRSSEIKQENCSYSQMVDSVVDLVESEENEEEFIDDLITIKPAIEKEDRQENYTNRVDKSHQTEKNEEVDEEEDIINNFISFTELPDQPNELEYVNLASKDGVDGIVMDDKKQPSTSALKSVTEVGKKTQMIEPLILLPNKKTTHVPMSKSKSSSSKHKHDKKSFKKHISNSQKEERKKKLKEIASKEKEDSELRSNKASDLKKPKVNVKVTNSNRGAFLTDVIQAVVKPMKRRESPYTSPKDEMVESSKDIRENTIAVKSDIEIKKSSTEKIVTKDSKKHKSRRRRKSHSKTHRESSESKEKESRLPARSLKPLPESDKICSAKPVSKVEPLVSIQSTIPKNKKKSVRFSEAPPQVVVFQIEPENRMTKTSLIKTTLLDVPRSPVFSLEKITLMKILRWNPHWLDEQMNNTEPPPILGHNNPPMTIFHSFNSHNQYVQLVGDLLLMEIWECITQGYMRLRDINNEIPMRIESLPPPPPQERCFELFNISVNMSLPKSEARNVPRMGEIMLVTFGPENQKTSRFFFVHNVKSLPSRTHNIHAFYSISLHATFTDKMKSLRPGEIMMGKILAYINKELTLFEAMEYLAGSPLSSAILRPEPRHFERTDLHPSQAITSKFMVALNESQLEAVKLSVSAALSDQPCIRMVQGPPGTGKSSVICAIVMAYFYDSTGKKQQNRGKILICATSNAAVDELVIRLLDIRQNLPKMERFRMVRVGRAEAMHPRAREVSSQQLAQRDATRLANEPVPHAAHEISHLEAKINMWRAAANNADPVRVAYCESRVAQLAERLALIRGGGVTNSAGEDLRPEQLAHNERRIVQGADIVVTTLASAANQKLRGLKRQIALCIVDEAGQAIEPESLIPLTLDVTKLTLIGDPQQLPGYICSQRAKKHGLGESLFSRLAGCAEQWRTNPVVLLRQQYRMHPHIADYPNRAFYDSRILSEPAPRPPLQIPPYAIVCIASGDKGQGSSGGNEMEAWGVSRLVSALCSSVRALRLSLAVITPYNAHKELLRRNLRLLQNTKESAVEVNTVDSFQGQERDVVVVSLARSSGVGFLTDAGRMNVMLTRAKHALLVCLNPHAMIKNQQWRTLVEDAQKRNLCKMLPNRMCQPVSAEMISNDEILKFITN